MVKVKPVGRALIMGIVAIVSTVTLIPGFSLAKIGVIVLGMLGIMFWVVGYSRSTREEKNQHIRESWHVAEEIINLVLLLLFIAGIILLGIFIIAIFIGLIFIKALFVSLSLIAMPFLISILKDKTKDSLNNRDELFNK